MSKNKNDKRKQKDDFWGQKYRTTFFSGNKNWKNQI